MNAAEDTTDPGLVSYRLEEHGKAIDDHERRLRRLEVWAFAMFGAAAGGSTLGAWIAKLTMGG